MARIGFIGTGAIAEAMVRGLAGRGHEIAISRRSAAISSRLAEAFSDVQVMENQAILDRSDDVFLCLLADHADEVLRRIAFRPGQRVVSVMLGVNLATLTRLCAPAREIAITIPLAFIQSGGCPLPVYPDSAMLRDLFGARNIVIPLAEEAALSPHFAATALCSTVFDQLRTGAQWLGGLTGDPRAAESYVVACLSGFLAGTPADGAGRIDAALASLDTEGGLNQTLREHMRAAGMNDQLREGLDAFRPRLGLPAKL
ncbi:NAD(P)-binding domain-containing protein [Phaeovulum sp. W22_SRMD_FR3]|uniref:NAD(P)-binding domain-containing protein n=1 Tax=Phaeovulum sp. W22_SRMD_FR3 TaxID=3240274 RepID=UPI003F9B3F3C